MGIEVFMRICIYIDVAWKDNLVMERVQDLKTKKPNPQHDYKIKARLVLRSGKKKEDTFNIPIDSPACSRRKKWIFTFI